MMFVVREVSRTHGVAKPECFIQSLTLTWAGFEARGDVASVLFFVIRASAQKCIHSFIRQPFCFIGI